MTVANLLIVASLLLFVALVVSFVLVLRRTATVVARSREDEAFRRDGASLGDRAGAAIATACERIDRVRRRQDAPDTIDDVLTEMLETLEGFSVEAEALAPPPVLASHRALIAEEIQRAMRAVGTVQHGCSLLSVTSGRPREMEGETSIKRGYLNLLHAREALISLGVDLRSGRADNQRWFSDRPSGE
jgi:hypothetical protein